MTSWKKYQGFLKGLTHLRITSRAFKSVKRDRRFSDFNRHATYMRALNAELWELVFTAGTPWHQVPNLFRARTGIELVRGLGKQSNKDPKFATARKFVDGGRVYSADYHVGWGARPSDVKFFRINFDIDFEARQFVIDGLLAHVPNYSAQFLH